MSSRRLESIDLLRGVVMALMVLDHVRDWVHTGIAGPDPTDLATTTPALFFTRWITHFCAPVFVLLSGVAAHLAGKRRTRPQLAGFLLTRGLWLILLELTLVRLGTFYNVDPRFIGALQVIWAIGVSMIVLAALVFLPLAAIGAFGVLLIAFHDLADGIRVPFEAQWGLQALWCVVHQEGAFQLFGRGPMVVILYPLVPWIGVMAAGYALGAVYGWEAPRRRRFLIGLGAALIAAFVVLRLANVYGDPAPWSPQPRGAVYTFLSFLNVSKYPPSLQYLLVTLGPGLLFLGAIEGRAAPAPLVTLGRVPLFFYLLQWPLAHGFGLIFCLITGHPTAPYFASPADPVFFSPGLDLGLPVVYATWLAALAILYPLCRWFAGVKARRKDWWLSYL